MIYSKVLWLINEYKYEDDEDYYDSYENNP
jgi:hypothetical protein